MFELHTIDGAQYEAWFEANRASLTGRGPFHEPTWLQAVSRGTRFRLGYIAAFDGGELVAVVPGFLAPPGPIKVFGSPLRGTMTSYLGVVSVDPRLATISERDVIAACAHFARRRWHAMLARFTIRDAPTDQPRVHSSEWHEQRPSSYRLDLSPGDEALFAQLKSHCRRNIRKARREGVEIVPIDDPHLFVRVLSESFRRHGASSWHSKRFFTTLMDELPRRGLGDVWGAQYDGQIIAVGLFLHDDREMHYLAGGSVGGYGSLPTSYLLHWHAIEAAARAGLEVFNSEASGIPSIDHFKETFNPQLERRSTLIWAPPTVRLAEASLRRWTKRALHFGERLRTVGQRIGTGHRAA